MSGGITSTWRINVASAAPPYGKVLRKCGGVGARTTVCERSTRIENTMNHVLVSIRYCRLSVQEAVRNAVIQPEVRSVVVR